MSGRSITIDCFRASRTSCGSKSFRLLTRRGGRGCSGSSIILIGLTAAPIFRSSEITLVLRRWSSLSAKWDWTQVICQRAERGDRQEQERTNDHDGAEEQTAKRHGIVAQGTETEWRALLHAQERRHRNRRDDRQIAAEQDDQAAGDIPRDSLRRGIRIA